MLRTRFAKEIVAEFLPSSRPTKKQRLIVLCDGMPSIPSKQPLAEFLAARGIYPRYRGAWESGGEFWPYLPQTDGWRDPSLRDRMVAGMVHTPDHGRLLTIMDAGAFLRSGDGSWFRRPCSRFASPAITIFERPH